MFILKEQMVQALKLDLVFVLDCDPQSTQHIKSIVDSALHILKIKLKWARLHYLCGNVGAGGHLMLLDFFEYS